MALRNRCIVVRASPTGNCVGEGRHRRRRPPTMQQCQWPAPPEQSPRGRARRPQPFLFGSEPVGRVAAKIALLSDRIIGEEERWPRRRQRAVDEDPTGPVQVLCAVAYEGLDLVVREKGEGVFGGSARLWSTSAEDSAETKRMSLMKRLGPIFQASPFWAAAFQDSKPNVARSATRLARVT